MANNLNSAIPKSNPISILFQKYQIQPNFFSMLQQDCSVFAPKKWADLFEQLSHAIKSPKYLYLFLKMNQNKIFSLYLGKSTTKGAARLYQHLDALKEVAETEKLNPNLISSCKPSLNSLYDRWFDTFFCQSPNTPIYLVIFEWKQEQPIHKIFPFPMNFNLDNAEAVLITYLSSQLPNIVLNHEFLSRLKWSTQPKLIQMEENQNGIEINGKNSVQLWQNWCQNWFFHASDIPITSKNSKNSEILIPEQFQVPIPLFELRSDSMEVKINPGTPRQQPTSKKLLSRHPTMMARVKTAVGFCERSYNRYFSESSSNSDLGKYLNDENQVFFCDGLIYMVYLIKSDLITLNSSMKNPKISQILSQVPAEINIIPIYIGKTEMLGRNGTYSANLKGVPVGSNIKYFARWGDDDARHIGGFSLRFFDIANNYPSTDYEPWIQILFNSAARKDHIPLLDFPVYFQMKPWYPFHLTFSGLSGLYTPEIETFLIALVRSLFPNILANKHNR